MGAETSPRRGLLWTAEEDAYLSEHASDRVHDIARALKRPVLGVRKRALVIGVLLPCPRIPSREVIRGLVERFATEAGCEPHEVLGVRYRTRHIAWARQQVCRELRALGYSLIGIGRALGIHHTTIMYNIKRSNRACPPPPKLHIAPPPPLRLRAPPPLQHTAVISSDFIAPPSKARLMGAK